MSTMLCAAGTAKEKGEVREKVGKLGEMGRIISCCACCCCGVFILMVDGLAFALSLSLPFSFSLA